jgi:hypothetical protein
MRFKSDLKLVKKIKGIENFDIKKFPQLYRCDMEFAKAQGNEELNKILSKFKLSGKYKYVSIDSRTHMLMEGMFPCIPGWHCDDFYRTAELGNQPDLKNVHKVAPAVHHMLILGDNSKTEFTTADVDADDPVKILEQEGKDKPVYLYYDKMLEEYAADSELPTVHVEPATIYTFGPTAFHRGQAATKNGWRFFIRVTESNHRNPKNEIRYQTQVYTDGRVSW